MQSILLVPGLRCYQISLLRRDLFTRNRFSWEDLKIAESAVALAGVFYCWGVLSLGHDGHHCIFSLFWALRPICGQPKFEFFGWSNVLTFCGSCLGWYIWCNMKGDPAPDFPFSLSRFRWKIGDFSRMIACVRSFIFRKENPCLFTGPYLSNRAGISGFCRFPRFFRLRSAQKHRQTI